MQCTFLPTQSCLVDGILFLKRLIKLIKAFRIHSKIMDFDKALPFLGHSTINILLKWLSNKKLN